MNTKFKVGTILLSAALLGACSTQPKNSNDGKTVSAQNPSAPAQVSKATDTTAAVKPAEAKAVDLTICKRPGEERSLEIETREPKGCKLWYSKFGNRSEVASSSVGSTHCETVRGRIEENLKTAGFQCQK